MVKGELWHEIHSRFKLKETKKSIARVVGLSIQTVRKILRQKQPQGYAREQQDLFRRTVLRIRALTGIPFGNVLTVRVGKVLVIYTGAPPFPFIPSPRSARPPASEPWPG